MRPAQSICFCPRLKPLLDQQRLGFRNTSRVVHGHDFAGHHLLVDGLGMLADEGFSVEPEIFRWHLLAMAQVAALGEHGLQFFIVKWGHGRIFT